MTRLQYIMLFCVAAALLGCASKPPKPPTPQVQSAITERLNDFSRAWRAGDASAVAECFVQRSTDEKDFAQSLGQLAIVQKELLKEQHAVPPDIASTVQMSEGTPMVVLNRPWHVYAYAASHPSHPMIRNGDGVMVHLHNSPDFRWSLRPIGDQWYIEPTAWSTDRPLGLVTDSIRRQIALTTSATKAIRAKNWEGLRGVMQQMHQQRMVDKISDSTNYDIPG
jgi:hypothetical protein